MRVLNMKTEFNTQRNIYRLLSENIQELKKYGIKNDYPQRYSVPWNKSDIDLISKLLSTT